MPQNAVQAALAGMTAFSNSVSFSDPAAISFVDKYSMSASYAAPLYFAES
jgi:hypothetical protein